MRTRTHLWFWYDFYIYIYIYIFIATEWKVKMNSCAYKLNDLSFFSASFYMLINVTKMFFPFLVIVVTCISVIILDKFSCWGVRDKNSLAYLQNDKKKWIKIKCLPFVCCCDCCCCCCGCCCCAAIDPQLSTPIMIIEKMTVYACDFIRIAIVTMYSQFVLCAIDR